MEDPETKQQLRVNTHHKQTRERFAIAAAAERIDLFAAIRKAGGDPVSLSTSGDWLKSFVEFVELRKEHLR